MKSTAAFKQTIQAHIETWAMEAEPNLEAYTSEAKKMDDCVTYILNQVKSSGVHGFADSDIFAMAEEYFTTPDIKVGGKISTGQVVVNHTIELTEPEKKAAKLKAEQEIISEEKSKARSKPKAKKKPAAKKKPMTDHAKKRSAAKAATTRKENAVKKANPTLF
jgi:hypothetical protein